MHTDALASVPRALTALVYQYRSLRSARRFAEQFFFSREVDLRGMMKFRDPKQTLLATVQKFGRERPISRYVTLLPSFWVSTALFVSWHVTAKLSPHLSDVVECVLW